MDAMVLKEDVDVLRTLRGKEIPADSSLGGEFVKALYARAAEQQRQESLILNMHRQLDRYLGM
jgi:hypothetical protein